MRLEQTVQIINDIERLANTLYDRVAFTKYRHWTYLQVLQALHQIVVPDWYFEIGIRRGASLQLADCRAIGVDPAYDLDYVPRGDTILFRQTSDDFFQTGELGNILGSEKIDFAFIDGWHNAEFAMRDFIHTEKFCSQNGIIVFDDVLPRTRDQAIRTPHGRAWTGDIWKVADCLAQFRPDLSLTFVDCLATGLLVVQDLNPNDEVLCGIYPKFEREVTSPGQLMPSRAYRRDFLRPNAAMEQVERKRRMRDTV